MPDLDADSILTFFDALNKRVELLQANIAKMGDDSGKRMKAAGDSVAGLDKSVVSLSKNLLGPIGLAGAFVAVAKSLDNFATGELRLQNLARNTGFATSAVLTMQAQFQRAGMTVEQANQQLGSIGSVLNNITLFREGSPAFQQIAEGSSKLAGDLLNASTPMERMDILMKSYNAGSDRWKLNLERIFQTSKTGFEVMNDQLDNHVHLWTFSDDETKTYRQSIVNVQNTMTNLSNSIQHTLLAEIIKITGGFGDMDKSAKTFSENFKTYMEQNVGPIFRREMETLGKLKEFMEWMATKMEGRQGPEGLGMLTEEELLKREGTYGQLFADNKYLLAGEGGAEKPQVGGKFFGTKGDYLLQGEGGRQPIVTTLESSEKSLRDIKDIMERQEIRAMGGLGGGGALSGGSQFGTGQYGGTNAPGTGGTGGTGASGGQGASGENVPSGKTSVKTAETQAIVAKVFKRAGYSDTAIAGIMGNIGPESSWNPNLRHPDQPRFTGEAHFAHGLFQEGGTEWNLYTQWLNKNHPGHNWTDPELQAQYVAERLKDPQYKKTYDALQNAKTPAEAAIQFQGGRGWGYLRPSAPTTGARVRDANRFILQLPDLLKEREQQPTQDRKPLDQSMRGGAAGPNGELNANVYFGNVPMGTSTDVQGKGFKTLRVTADKNNQQAREGMLGPGNDAYTAFVP